MKQAILIFLCFCIVSVGSSQILYGVKAGANLSTFTGNDVANAKFHPSFNVGGFVNFLLSEKITLQPELLFSGKGAKSDATGTYRLGYITLPVLLQYNDASGFFAEGGLQAGLLTTAKLKGSTRTTDVKKQLNSADFSWVVGLGYKMTRGFGVGARYDFGFYNIANAGIIRNKTIMLSLMYTFGPATE